MRRHLQTRQFSQGQRQSFLLHSYTAAMTDINTCENCSTLIIETHCCMCPCAVCWRLVGPVIAVVGLRLLCRLTAVVPG